MRKTWAFLIIAVVLMLLAAGQSWGRPTALMVPGTECIFYESKRDSSISQIYRMDRQKIYYFEPTPHWTTSVTEKRVSDLAFSSPRYQHRYPTAYWKFVTSGRSRYTEITIAYTSLRGSNWNIYTNDDLGTSESAPLVSGVEAKRNLRWSPDGKWISYIQKSGQVDTIYRVTASGDPPQSNTIASETVIVGETAIVGHGWIDNDTIIYARPLQQILDSQDIQMEKMSPIEFVITKADGSTAGERYPIKIITSVDLVACTPLSPCTFLDMKVSNNHQYVALAWEYKILGSFSKRVAIRNLAKPSFFWKKTVIETGDVVNDRSKFISIGWSGNDNILYVAHTMQEGSSTTDEKQMEIFAYTLNLNDPDLAATQERYTTNSHYDAYQDGALNTFWLLPRLPRLPRLPGTNPP